MKTFTLFIALTLIFNGITGQETHTFKTRLVNYKGQCTIIRPRQDVIPGDASYEIGELIPQAKIVIIERSGHYPQVENPKAFFPALKRAFTDSK